MRNMICALIVLVSVLGAMEKGNERDYRDKDEEVSEIEYDIGKLKELLAFVGQASSEVIVEEISEYLRTNELNLLNLWYTPKGNNNRPQNFFTDVIYSMDVDLVVGLARKYPEILCQSVYCRYNPDEFLRHRVFFDPKYKKQKDTVRTIIAKLKEIPVPEAKASVVKRREIDGSRGKKSPAVDTRKLSRSTLYISYNQNKCLEPLLDLITQEEMSIKMIFETMRNLTVAQALSDARARGVRVKLMLNRGIPKDDAVIDRLSNVEVHTYDGSKLTNLNIALFEGLHTCLHGSWFPMRTGEHVLALMTIDRNAENHYSKLKELFKTMEGYHHLILSLLNGAI